MFDGFFKNKFEIVLVQQTNYNIENAILLANFILKIFPIVIKTGKKIFKKTTTSHNKNLNGGKNFRKADNREGSQINK